MKNMLVRMLSTGRVGTKFIAAAFADQGYQAYHENLYEGEPSSAILQYIRMLGDLWKTDRDRYYSLESDFARPYLDAVTASLDLKPSLNFWARIFTPINKPGNKAAVIHSGNRLTTATPLIEREAKKRGIDIKTLVLFRNPLKTIHAIYTVESPASAYGGAYHNRPSLFFSEKDHKGAADIWSNTYMLAHDLSIQFGADRYQKVNLENFNVDIGYAKEIFAFLNLPFLEEKYLGFIKFVLNEPLRSTKTNDTRNSDLFHNPGFKFTKQQVTEIHERIKETLQVYSIEWDAVVNDYYSFHSKEKQTIGFS